MVSELKTPNGSALLYSWFWSHVALTICSLTRPCLHILLHYHPWIMAWTHTQPPPHTHTHPHTHCGLTAAAKWSQYVCVFSSISCQFSHWHRQMHITNDNNPLSFQFTFILYKQKTEQMIPNTERVTQAFSLPEKQFDCKYLMIFIFLNDSIVQN